MDEEDAYDVRAVEARLAHMEATRRARATVSTHRPAATKQIQRPAVVSDFELSTMDSSDSEHDDGVSTSSASDDEDDDLAVQPRVTKLRLRDSLDLSMSMSMSMAMPAAPVVARVKPKMHATRRQEPDASTTPRSSDSQVVSSTHATAAKRDIDTDGEGNLFAGKLVQRRRELEKQAEQQHHRDARSMESAWRSPVMEVKPSLPTADLPIRHKGALKPPGVAVARVPVRNEVKEMKHDHAPSYDMAKPTTNTLEPSLQPFKDPPDNHRANVPVEIEKSRETTARRTVAVVPEVVVGIPLKKTDTTTANKQGLKSSNNAATLAAVASPPMKQQAPQLLPSRVTPAASQDVPSKNLLLVPPTAKKPLAAPTAISPPITSASMTIAPAANTKPSGPSGYTRPHAMTNQPPVVSAPPVKKALSPTKREPEDIPTDDIIDDLLTAEELRLRDSLDKLSQRLSSLASSTRTTTAPRPVPLPSNQSTTLDSTGTDDNKTVRSAAYGGGTHSRLHQPTSPTARTSHARRSELSGGVHKARVRTGGVTAQEAAASRTDATGDSKHKITVKRDLAHLLF